MKKLISSLILACVLLSSLGLCFADNYYPTEGTTISGNYLYQVITISLNEQQTKDLLFAMRGGYISATIINQLKILTQISTKIPQISAVLIGSSYLIECIDKLGGNKGIYIRIIITPTGITPYFWCRS